MSPARFARMHVGFARRITTRPWGIPGGCKCGAPGMPCDFCIHPAVPTIRPTCRQVSTSSDDANRCESGNERTHSKHRLSVGFKHGFITALDRAKSAAGPEKLAERNPLAAGQCDFPYTERPQRPVRPASRKLGCRTVIPSPGEVRSMRLPKRRRRRRPSAACDLKTRRHHLAIRAYKAAPSLRHSPDAVPGRPN